jgi:transcriptional regulator with GAF, ATPase, and Fis domain
VGFWTLPLELPPLRELSNDVIGLGGVDKVLVRLEDYYNAETAVWQPELPSRGLLLGRYAL